MMPNIFLSRVFLSLKGHHDDLSIGKCYEEGLYVPKDLDQAIIHYHQAIQKGKIEAYYRLGQCHEEKGDITQALENYLDGAKRESIASRNRLEELASAENITAQHFLELLKEFQSYQQTVSSRNAKYTQLALDAFMKTEAQATFYSARMYELGEGGFVQNKFHAVSYYMQASFSGNEYAEISLKRIYSQSDREFNHVLKTYYSKVIQGNEDFRSRLVHFSSLGFVGADYYLGKILEHEEKWQEALACYEQVADKDEVPMIYRASIMYRIGLLYKGVEKKYKVYEKRPKFLPDKSNNYSEHRKVIISKDLSKEIFWYKQAAIAGSKYALNALIEHVTFLDQFMPDYNDMAPRWREMSLRPLGSRVAPASFYLAQMYEKGEGGLCRNMAQAVKYYKITSLFPDFPENQEANWQLAQIYAIGEGEIQTDADEACKYYFDYIKRLFVRSCKIETVSNPNKQNSVLEAIVYCTEQASGREQKEYEEYFSKNIKDIGLYLELGQIFEQGRNNHLHATTFYKMASDLRDLGAMYHLGCMYAAGGNGLSEDIDKACEYYIKFLHAHPFLHDGEKFKAEVMPEEILKALLYCMEARDHGQREAKDYIESEDSEFNVDFYIEVGRRYEEGRGIPQNTLNASKFYIIAAYLGNIPALLHLGRIYTVGDDGIPQDILKACEYYSVAVEKGSPTAHEGLELLAKAGNAEAQYALGYVYYHSKVKDYLEAIKWCVQASDQNHEAAHKYLTKTEFDSDLCLKIADIYERGEGVLKNKQHALNFYKKASWKNRDAAFRVGQMYAEGGDGMPKDRQLSYQYYAIAARNGHSVLDYLKDCACLGDADAQYALGYYYCLYKGDQEEAARWCMKAAEKGHKEAEKYLKEEGQFSVSTCLRIANWYEYGEEVQVDLSKAVVFYDKASELGDKDSAYYLGQLYQADDENIEKAYQYYTRAAQLGHVGAVMALNTMDIEIKTQTKKDDLYRSINLFKGTDKVSMWHMSVSNSGNKTADGRLRISVRQRSMKNPCIKRRYGITVLSTDHDQIDHQLPLGTSLNLKL